MTKPVLHYIHACPFCQRVEILLDLKGQRAAVDLAPVDITVPRPPELLALTRGSTSLPVLVIAEGVLKESLVIMRYLDAALAGPVIAREAPYERAVEEMLIALAGDFTAAGYRLIKNRDESQREPLRAAMLEQYRLLEDFLAWQSPDGVFLFDRFGLAEAAFTPMFMRFWFLDYYEGFELRAAGFERVRRWRAACLEHPAAQQVSREEILKLYYDYAVGTGNGAVPPGRARSSFVSAPHWRQRPWPPQDKYSRIASDAELGLA